MEQNRELADISPEGEAIIVAKIARLLLRLEQPDITNELKVEIEQDLSALEVQRVLMAVRRAGLDRRYHSRAA